jgi:hypothetical protein
MDIDFDVASCLTLIKIQKMDMKEFPFYPNLNLPLDYLL